MFLVRRKKIRCHEVCSAEERGENTPTTYQSPQTKQKLTPNISHYTSTINKNTLHNLKRDSGQDKKLKKFLRRTRNKPTKLGKLFLGTVATLCPQAIQCGLEKVYPLVIASF